MDTIEANKKLAHKIKLSDSKIERLERIDKLDDMLTERLLDEFISAGTFSIATLALYSFSDSLTLGPTDLVLNSAAIFSGLVSTSKIYMFAEAGLKKLKLNLERKKLKEELDKIGVIPIAGNIVTDSITDSDDVVEAFVYDIPTYANGFKTAEDFKKEREEREARKRRIRTAQRRRNR